MFRYLKKNVTFSLIADRREQRQSDTPAPECGVHRNVQDFGFVRRRLTP
jgi:hypothetical protein